VIGYGGVQAIAPRFTQANQVTRYGALLTLAPLGLAAALWYGSLPVSVSIMVGLGLFGVLFAINSSLHSYLIVAHARVDGVSLDVGFYYMANAAGRLLGTVLSGYVYQQAGLVACLLISAGLLAASTVIVSQLPGRLTVSSTD
jgi:predicted MFS family arabinose efflux permease